MEDTHTGAASTGGHGGHAPPHFFAKQNKINKNTVNWKMNKLHEIVKRSHHSIYSGSRENHCTLIYGEENCSSLTAFSKQTIPLCPSQQQTLPQSSKIYQPKPRMTNITIPQSSKIYQPKPRMTNSTKFEVLSFKLHFFYLAFFFFF